MDYLLSNMGCFGFNASSQLDCFKVEKKKKIIDVDKSEVIDLGLYSLLIELLQVGKTYKVVEKWALTKNGSDLEVFDTEEECQKAYDKLIETLKQEHKVIKV